MKTALVAFGLFVAAVAAICAVTMVLVHAGSMPNSFTPAYVLVAAVLVALITVIAFCNRTHPKQEQEDDYGQL